MQNVFTSILTSCIGLFLAGEITSFTGRLDPNTVLIKPLSGRLEHVALSRQHRALNCPSHPVVIRSNAKQMNLPFPTLLFDKCPSCSFYAFFLKGDIAGKCCVERCYKIIALMDVGFGRFAINRALGISIFQIQSLAD